MARSNQQVETRPDGTAVAGGLALLFVGLGGMTAWAMHFWSVYALVEIGCRTEFPGFAVAGMSGLQVLLIVVTVVFGLVALAAAVVALRIRRRTAGAETDTGREGPAAFVARIGLLLSGAFLVAIVLAAIPAFVLRPCG